MGLGNPEPFHVTYVNFTRPNLLSTTVSNLQNGYHRTTVAFKISKRLIVCRYMEERNLVTVLVE